MSELLERLCAFICERQSVYVKKAAGLPRPWTDDPVLDAYKINNIFRRQDRFSVFERGEIEGQPFHEQLFRIAILRQSLTIRAYKLFKDRRIYALEDIDRARKLWPGVQLVNNCVLMYVPTGLTRSHHLLMHYNFACRADWAAHYLLKQESAENVVRWLHAIYPTLGPFRIYEVYTSLTYCDEFPFTENDFLHIGPGSACVLRDLLGGAVTLQSVQGLADKMAGITGLPMTVRSVEDACCEFRKYESIKAGRGRKIRYHGAK